MQTKPKSNSVVTHALRDDGCVVFSVKGCEPIVFDPAKASDVCRARAMRHGFVQRIADGAALSRNTADGKPATPQAKRDAMARIADHYMTGTEAWGLDREGGGPGLDTLAIAAVAEATGKTTDAVRAMIASGAERRSIKPTAFLAALATAEKVAPILARMRAAGAGASGDDILAEMEAEAEGDADEGDDDTTE